MGQIKKVQLRVAPCTICNSDRISGVSAILETLGLHTLEQKRADLRLCHFSKIVDNMIAGRLPDYETYETPVRSSATILRHFNDSILERTSISFIFSPTVNRSALPESAVSSPSLDIFKAEIGKLQHAKP